MHISIIIIFINWIVSSFCWSPIRFDVWGEYKGHWGLCMMYYWMEINGSLFCQLLLAISPTICCLLQKVEGPLFLSLLFLFLSVSQKNRLRLRVFVRGSWIHFFWKCFMCKDHPVLWNVIRCIRRRYFNVVAHSFFFPSKEQQWFNWQTRKPLLFQLKHHYKEKSSAALAALG